MSKRRVIILKRHGRTLLQLRVPSASHAFPAARKLFERWGWLGGVSVHIRPL